jgi:two-component system, OmpR family, phosphate regulon sensor histidine kinase PhoR
MIRNTNLLIKIRQALKVIPNKFNLEIQNEIINSNINRVLALSVLLIVMNLIMIIIDLTFYYTRLNSNIGYANLFYAHIFMLVERSLYLFGVPIVNNKKFNLTYKLKKYLIIYSYTIALFWCSYLSINAQNIHGQISAFIIGSFSIASTILMLPKQGLFIFSTNSCLFAIFLYFTPKGHEDFPSNLVNILFVLNFAFLLSLINITMYYRNYINRQTIQLQTRELASSRDKLDDMVKTRTEELIRANEQLIKEMGIRHEVEMQSIKTRLMYEENTMLLKEIKEYEELRNVFFANLSHELRTPLNVIFSAQQMMNFIVSKQTCYDCKNQISKYNKIVKQNCYRLIRLIGNLIDITKIDAKYFEIKKKNCDIVKVIENITQSVAEYIKDKNIELCFDTDMEEKVIACDPDKIERIILNLLSNAVKFTPVNGQINVYMRKAQDYIIISVKDTGIGISKEMQQVVFERFIQADKSMTRNREGSGIGLSLVKSLVDLHQGRISIISEPGKGSEFVIELPDEVIPFEDYIACTYEDNGENIDRIHIEFSDIYS